jgi:multiple sugar transport system substrate-binding protein
MAKVFRPEGSVDLLGLRFSRASMPAPDGVYPGTSVAGGASLVIFHGWQHRDLAWKVIEYLSEPKQQVQF